MISFQPPTSSMGPVRQQQAIRIPSQPLSSGATSLEALVAAAEAALQACELSSAQARLDEYASIVDMCVLGASANVPRQCDACTRQTGL